MYHLNVTQYIDKHFFMIMCKQNLMSLQNDNVPIIAK